MKAGLDDHGGVDDITHRDEDETPLKATMNGRHKRLSLPSALRVDIEVAEDDTRWLAEECIATSLHLLKWHGLKFDDEHSVLKVYFNHFEFLSIVYCQSLMRRILIDWQKHQVFCVFLAWLKTADVWNPPWDCIVDGGNVQRPTSNHWAIRLLNSSIDL
ncbi:hypothetical protein NA56DRAFT_706269 [Hyaloscypha hepaticicola]|uniref:Uncharacterized protein n=1 Tax=Hyaloscypha hepaticicola TaxID=2082293 RepID=A0A2J6PXJ8_9HELO|nr:hypothetical protein NA56DRAFT_706269 [Hyaloscypha hepaticicola]